MTWEPPSGPAPPSPPPPGEFPAEAGPRNQIAFVSFFFSTAAATLLYVHPVLAPGALALGIVGTVCAWIGRQRVKRGETMHNAMWADVGLAVGGLAAGVSLLFCIGFGIALLVD